MTVLVGLTRLLGPSERTSGEGRERNRIWGGSLVGSEGEF